MIASSLEQFRLDNQQQRQRNENEQLRQTITEQRKQQAIEMERLKLQMAAIPSPQVCASSGPYMQSTSVSSHYPAKYGMTERGILCRNCIQLGSRCHRHSSS
jgi:histidinol-phosphate/aromatic aminotransferase/cobyric acid decarboxylase-like protein